PARPAVRLTLPANSLVVGDPVTLEATVQPTGSNATPTGTVTFLEGNTELGHAELDRNGVARLTLVGIDPETPPLAVGQHPITAVYGGDRDFAGSTSPVMTQEVDPNPNPNPTPTPNPSPTSSPNPTPTP